MHRNRSLWLLAALMALKLSLMLIDGRPSVFMGDSGSYLYTALHDYIPHDRSWAYGYLLRPLAIWPHSMRFLLVVQAAVSAVSAWLIAVILTTGFAIRFRWAALSATLCAIEPLQLLSERYIMTDTAALFLFALLTAISVSFLRRRTQGKMALAFVIGVALISIRMSYLPLVLLNSLLLPLIWFWDRRALARKFAPLLLVWLAVGQLLLYGYRCVNASVSKMAHPEYMYMDGFILLSDVAPIVIAEDFPDSAQATRILRDVRASLTEPVYREAHLFSRDGLDWAIRRAIPDEYEANKFAKCVALHAIVFDAGGFVALAARTWAEYFDVPLFRGYIRYDEGGLQRADESFREEIRKVFDADLGRQSFDGPVWIWHRAALPWYWLIVIAPLAVPIIIFRKRGSRDAPTALVLLWLLILFAQTMFLAPHAEPRYLMPIAWLMFLCLPVSLSANSFPSLSSLRLRSASSALNPE